MRIKPRTSVLNNGHPLSKGLVAAWSFLQLTDLRNNLTLTKTGNVTQQTGRYGKEYNFPGGASTWLTMADDPRLDISGKITLVILLKAGTFPSYWQAIIAKRVVADAPCNYELGAKNTDGTLVWFNGSTVSESSFIPTPGIWYRVVVTCDNTTAKFYVNGVFHSSAAATLGAENAGAFWIGSFDHSTDEPFVGSIAEVRIYDRVLTASEVKLDYQDMWGIYRRISQNQIGKAVTTPLDAEFSADVTSPDRDQVVTFTDSSTGAYAPTTWSWTFGDGGTSILQNPTHTYVTAGTYTVALTVTNENPAGAEESIETKTNYISVQDFGAFFDKNGNIIMQWREDGNVEFIGDVTIGGILYGGS